MSDQIPVHALDPTGADATNNTPRYDPATGSVAWAGSGAVAVEDESGEILAAVKRLNFMGSGVTVADAGSGEVTITIPGGGAGGATTEPFEDVVNAIPNKVHRWTFDETSGATVADSIGALPLTLSGTYTRGVAGLTGAASATTLGAAAKAMSTGLGSIPVGAATRCQIIVYRHNGSLAAGTLMSYGAGASRQWWTPAVSASDAQSFRCMTYGDDLNVPNTPALDKEWHLAAFGFDGDRTVLAYLDGVAYAHRIGATLNTYTPSNFTVGAAVSGASYSDYLLGDVDDVIVTTAWPGKKVLDRMAKSLGLIE